MAPKYTVLYFNSRGRAEPARMLLTLAGQNFLDYRFKEGEWDQIKTDKKRFPLGQAPVLMVDDKAIPQSKAMQCYLANEFGFYGANNFERADIDVICETVDDILKKLVPIYYEKDEAKKAELVEKFKTSTKVFLDFLNEEIKKAGGKFFVGGKVSLADLVVYNGMEWVNRMHGDGAATNWPGIAAFCKNFPENSKLADYIKNRPQTEH